MQLVSISYKEFEGQDQEWTLDKLTLKDRNLLVGKNATGKTRVLNIIGSLARVLTGQMSPCFQSGEYNAIFANKNSTIKYSFLAENEKVVREEYSVDGRKLLIRSDGGIGTIFAERIDSGTNIEFQTPQNELAAVVRRDTIQHPFLESLFLWGESVRHYQFSGSFGKESYLVLIPKDQNNLKELDDKQKGQAVEIYRTGISEFKESYKAAILNDLERMDYPTKDIGIGPPISVKFPHDFPGEVVGLWLKENGLRSITDQNSMSQGMFRVLSILILTNYLIMGKTAGCILIDDIGEGLDFDRSCILIDLIRDKAKASSIQLVFSTNDKFVMNRVPLEEWSVLQRNGGHVRVLNAENSSELFEEFKFTGLSNFSFLEMDYANQPPAEVG